MPSSTLEGNSACHGFDNGSKPLCASFTNPIRCTIPFVHVKMYAVDVFTQFTHAPFTISNEFTTVCWVCYTLILDAFPPVHNISKSETHFNIFEQYNKGNISTQHIFFMSMFYCSTSFYIWIIMIITSILQGSGFFPTKSVDRRWNLRFVPETAPRRKAAPGAFGRKSFLQIIEQHSYCTKRKRERYVKICSIWIYMPFQEMFFSRRCSLLKKMVNATKNGATFHSVSLPES